MNKSVYQAASDSLAGNMMNLPKTNEFMQNSIYNFENRITNPEFQVIKNFDNDIINNNLGLTGKDRIPDGWRGIFFNSNSSIAEKIINSYSFRDYLKSNIKNIIRGNNVDNLITFDKYKDKDLFGSIHNATVLYPHFDKNGNFSAIIFDKYDFKFEQLPKYKAEPIFTTVNNVAAFLEAFKEIKNYYILIDIKVDKSQFKKLN